MITLTISSLHWVTKDLTDSDDPEDVVIGAAGGGVAPQRVQWMACGDRYCVEPYYN
jgi:hypothetical protein